ncbi:MAG: holdfast attachment protein HfaA [Brevundimonas sp.]|jgi:holdfast attachment protein HfaA|nr:holdfast attachment protein HfaA [Brevundimonas sp.]
MPRSKTPQTALTGTICLAVLAGLAAVSSAQAQSTGSSGLSSFQAGYGGSRYTTATAQTGSTRDANGNRLIVDGIIQSGASSYSSATGGVASSYAGAGSSSSGGTVIGGSTAIGNSLNVVVQGNHNTVIVNSRQTNTGNITAGTALNGTLNLGN